MKGINGILEVIGGILLLFLSPERLNKIIRFITQNELSEDPNDFVMNHLVTLSQSFSISNTLRSILFNVTRYHKVYADYFGCGARSCGHILLLLYH